MVKCLLLGKTVNAFDFIVSEKQLHHVHQCCNKVKGEQLSLQSATCDWLQIAFSSNL